MGRGKLATSLVIFVALVVALWALILYRQWTPQLGLDLQGGVSITLAPAPGQTVDDGVLDQTVSIIRNRIDALGVAEPDISRQGTNVIVQLPGLADQEEAEDVIGRTAQLQMRPVLSVIPPEDPKYAETGEACDASGNEVPAATKEVVLCAREFAPIEQPSEGALPPAQAAVSDQELPRDQWPKYTLAPAALTGDDIAGARAVPTQSGLGYEVQLDLTKAGAPKFEKITGELACKDAADPQRQFAVVLDDVVESAPGISDEIVCNQGIGGGRAVITVGGGEEEARELALVLRTGALPITMEIQESRSVSPTLGASSLQAGLLAGAIGLALVCVYLIFLYRGIGLAAIAELAMFGIITIGLIIVLGNTVGFALTLAGIAGVIVSIGIAADSSIIYRERFRDELRAGRTIRTAADRAFANAWRTNLTGNTVSFLAAVILYLLAVGPVRGFAFTLGLSTLIDTILFFTFTRSMFGLIARSPKLAASRAMGLRAGVVDTPTNRELTRSGTR